MFNIEDGEVIFLRVYEHCSQSNQIQAAMVAKFILFYCCIASLRILKNSKELRPYGGNHELLHLYDIVKVFDSLNRVLACVIDDSAAVLSVDL